MMMVYILAVMSMLIGFLLYEAFNQREKMKLMMSRMTSPQEADVDMVDDDDKRAIMVLLSSLKNDENPDIIIEPADDGDHLDTLDDAKSDDHLEGKTDTD
jgi:hypothetical protein